MNSCTRDQHALGNHCNAMAACRQRDERLWGGAFEDNVGPDVRSLAGDLELFARGEGASEQQ